MQKKNKSIEIAKMAVRYKPNTDIYLVNKNEKTKDDTTVAISSEYFEEEKVNNDIMYNIILGKKGNALFNNGFIVKIKKGKQEIILNDHLFWKSIIESELLPICKKLYFLLETYGIYPIEYVPSRFDARIPVPNIPPLTDWSIEFSKKINERRIYSIKDKNGNDYPYAHIYITRDPLDNGRLNGSYNIVKDLTTLLAQIINNSGTVSERLANLPQFYTVNPGKSTNDFEMVTTMMAGANAPDIGDAINAIMDPQEKLEMRRFYNLFIASQNMKEMQEGSKTSVSDVNEALSPLKKMVEHIREKEPRSVFLPYGFTTTSGTTPTLLPGQDAIFDRVFRLVALACNVPPEYLDAQGKKFKSDSEKAETDYQEGLMFEQTKFSEILEDIIVPCITPILPAVKEILNEKEKKEVEKIYTVQPDTENPTTLNLDRFPVKENKETLVEEDDVRLVLSPDVIPDLQVVVQFKRPPVAPDAMLIQLYQNNMLSFETVRNLLLVKNGIDPDIEPPIDPPRITNTNNPPEKEKGGNGKKEGTGKNKKMKKGENGNKRKREEKKNDNSNKKNKGIEK